MKEKEAEPMEEDDAANSKQVIETVVGKSLINQIFLISHIQ